MTTYDRMIMAILAVLADTQLLSHQISTSELFEKLTPHLTWVSLGPHFNSFQITDEMRQPLAREFFSQRCAQWNEPSRQRLYNLSTMTHFKVEDIKLIQQEFDDILFLSTRQNGEQTPGASNDMPVTILEESMGISMQLIPGKITPALKKQDFVTLMARLCAHKTLENRLSFMRHIQYGRLFDLMDEYGMGLLDFRNVLVVINLLTRGTAQERVDLLFMILDEKKQGFFTFEQLERLLNILGDMMLSLELDDENEKLNEELMSKFSIVTLDDVNDFKSRSVIEIFRCGTEREKTVIYLFDLHELRKDHLFSLFASIVDGQRMLDDPNNIGDIMFRFAVEKAEQKLSGRKRNMKRVFPPVFESFEESKS